MDEINLSNNAPDLVDAFEFNQTYGENAFYQSYGEKAFNSQILCMMDFCNLSTVKIAGYL